MRHMLTIPLLRNASGISAIFSLIFVFATIVYAQNSAQALEHGGDRTSPTEQDSLPDSAQIQPIQTDSPRDTLITFLRLTRELEDSLLAYRKTGQ